MFQTSLWLVLFPFIAEGLGFGYKSFTMTFVSITQSNASAVWDLSKTRLIGRERMLNGTATLSENLTDDHWSFTVELYSDSTGEGNYKLLPFGIQNTPACKGYKKYRRYFSNHAKYGEQTDFPLHLDVCPIPKGTYFLKNIILSEDGYPPFVHRGYLLVNGTYYYDGINTGYYTIVVRLEDAE
ncbi:uncharacterized protein [Drosophila takahashii]|uniref:uncharacterized protein n=1 Tax=Drosophila takahashii TaxID=29030 RepID=UPI001CF90EF3|nr:uncharacterized protein LOC108064366 [Drosophila takahashii]